MNDKTTKHRWWSARNALTERVAFCAYRLHIISQTMLRMPLPVVLSQNVNGEMSQRSVGWHCVCIAYIAVHLKSLKHSCQLFLALYIFIRSYLTWQNESRVTQRGEPWKREMWVLISSSLQINRLQPRSWSILVTKQCICWGIYATFNGKTDWCVPLLNLMSF